MSTRQRHRHSCSGSLVGITLTMVFIVGLLWAALPQLVIAVPVAQLTPSLPSPIPSSTTTANAIPTEENIVFDDDWIQFVELTPIENQPDILPQPPSTVENPGWDLTRTSGKYQPSKLWFPAGRPQILTDFPDEPSRKLWEALQSGSLKYETFNFQEKCVQHGISAENCTVTRYYTAMPSKDAFLGCLTVQVYGGVPCWETLAVYHMESGNSNSVTTVSSALARGPYQEKDWFYNNWHAYPGGSQTNWIDPAFAASNWLLDTNTVSMWMSQSDYADSFRGNPCVDMTTCKYLNKAKTAGYNDFAWNNHYGEANATYLLATQLHTLWNTFYP